MVDGLHGDRVVRHLKRSIVGLCPRRPTMAGERERKKRKAFPPEFGTTRDFDCYWMVRDVCFGDGVMLEKYTINDQKIKSKPESAGIRTGTRLAEPKRVGSGNNVKVFFPFCFSVPF